jgi:predicted O-methyltransferase YrrM
MRARRSRGQVSPIVDIHVGSALDPLWRLAAPFDFVLIDLWKDLYVKCLDAVYPRLAPGAYVAADNMIYPEFARADAARYQLPIRQLEFDSVLLPIGGGIEPSRRR